MRQGAVIEAGLAFAVDGIGNALHALNPDGSVAWRTGVPVGLLAADTGQIFHLGDDDGAVIALNAQTGEVNWTTAAAGTAGVRAIGAGSGRVVVLTDEVGVTVRAFDQQSGAWPGPGSRARNGRAGKAAPSWVRR